MAVLGSTVDPRLGAVSPAAIQALSQAGAASGQMYANLGGSIAGVIKDFKDRRDDQVMAQALSESFVGEEDPKFSPKAFREKMKGKKVSAKKIKEFVSDTLQETKLQTDIANAEKEAERENDKVALERERNNFLQEQAIRQQTALESQLEKDLAQIAMQREKIAKDEKLSEDAKAVRLKEINDRATDRREKYDLDVQEIESKKPLMDAQIKYYESLGEKSLAEAAESRAFANEGLYESALNPVSINRLAEDMGTTADDLNSRSPIEMAQILDRYMKNIGSADPEDPRLADYLKMQQGYETRAAGQAALKGQSFNANTALTYRAAQAAENAEAAGLPALTPGGNFGDSITFGEALQDRAGEAAINLGQKAATGISNFIKSADLSMPKMDPQNMSGSYSLGRFN